MDLSPLLEPRSIAIVGATDRAGAYADLVLRNLEASEYPGTVWGVNPKRDRGPRPRVLPLGRPSCPSRWTPWSSPFRRRACPR